MLEFVVKSRCKNRSIKQQNLSNLFHHHVFLIQKHTFNYIRRCYIKKITTNVSLYCMKGLKVEEFERFEVWKVWSLKFEVWRVSINRNVGYSIWKDSVSSVFCLLFFFFCLGSFVLALFFAQCSLLNALCSLLFALCFFQSGVLAGSRDFHIANYKQTSTC